MALGPVITGDNRYGGARGVPEGKRRRNAVQITFGDGVATYPSLGIPLPTRGSTGFGGFGLVRFLERLQIDSPSPGDGYVYKWDSVNNSIRIYQVGAAVATPLAEVSTAFVPANNTTLYATAVGW